MHAVILFGENDTETSQSLQILLADAWLRPYMRPRWLKVDPYRAQISDKIMNWCEQQVIEVVDSAGKAKEQQAKLNILPCCLRSCWRTSWQMCNHRWSTSGEGASTRCREPRTCCRFVVSLRCSWSSAAVQRSQGTSSENPDQVVNSRYCTTEGLDRRREFGRSREQS